VSSFDGADWMTFLAPATRCFSQLAGLGRQEESGAIDDHIGADFIPLQFGRILHRAEANLPAIDDQIITIDGDLALEIPMNRVEPEHVGQVFGIEKVVDADDLNPGELGFLRDCAENHASDTSKTINANA